MPSVEAVDLAIRSCSHIKPAHRITREKIRAYILQRRIEYVKEHKVFLIVNLEEAGSRISMLKRMKDGFACSCKDYAGADRVPGRASCEHEAALFVAFKLKYFSGKPLLVVWGDR